MWHRMRSNGRAIRNAIRLPLLILPLVVLLLVLVRSAATPQLESFRFVILGDRTGGAQSGVYEQAWQEAAEEGPALVVTPETLLKECMTSPRR
jgi:hypothetical protein